MTSLNKNKKNRKGPKIKEHINVIYESLYCKKVCILYDSALPKIHEEMTLSFNLRSQHIQKEAAFPFLWC